jgi:hypothetical protein
MAEKAKTADRAKAAQIEQTPPCPLCGKPTRYVKRMKNREMAITGGMYLSCSACDFAEKRN